jgi:hypothetical protein
VPWNYVSSDCTCLTCFPHYPNEEAGANTSDGQTNTFGLPSSGGGTFVEDCCQNIVCPDQKGGKLYLWNPDTLAWDLIYGCCQGSATAVEPPVSGATYDKQGQTLGQLAWVCCADPCVCTPAGYAWWEASLTNAELDGTISWTLVEDNCNSACAKYTKPDDFVKSGNGPWMTRWYVRTCCTAACIHCTQESMYEEDEDLILTIAGASGTLANASGYSPPAGTINCDGSVAGDAWSSILNKSWSIPNLYPTGGGCQFYLAEDLCTLEDTCPGPTDATVQLQITVTISATDTTVVFVLGAGCGGLSQTRTFIKTHSGTLNCKSIGNIPFSSKTFSGYGGDPTTMYGLDGSAMTFSIP